MVRKLGLEENKITSDIKQVKDDIKFIQEMNRNLQDPEYLAKTKVPGSKEAMEFGEYSEKVNLYSTVKNGIIDEAIGNKQKQFRNVY